VTDDVVIKIGASYAGGYGSRVSTWRPFNLTPSLRVYSLVRSYLQVYKSRYRQPNISVLRLVVLPVREVPGSDSGPEIGCSRGVQLFPLWAGSRAARVKITMSSNETALIVV
jgi:hypothetical protein